MKKKSYCEQYLKTLERKTNKQLTIELLKQIIILQYMIKITTEKRNNQ